MDWCEWMDVAELDRLWSGGIWLLYVFPTHTSRSISHRAYVGSSTCTIDNSRTALRASVAVHGRSAVISQDDICGNLALAMSSELNEVMVVLPVWVYFVASPRDQQVASAWGFQDQAVQRRGEVVRKVARNTPGSCRAIGS